MLSGMNRSRSMNAIFNRYAVVLPCEGVQPYNLVSYPCLYFFKSTVQDDVSANIGLNTGLTVNIHTSS